MAAAMRASMASHQDERSHVQERSVLKPRREEKLEPDEMRNNRGMARPTNDIQGIRVEVKCIGFIYYFV